MGRARVRGDDPPPAGAGAVRGPREIVTLWQTQPQGAPERWAQLLAEILPPGMGGPLLPAQQPEVEIVLGSLDGRARLSRQDAARLSDALRRWLERTRWTAELPPAPAAARPISPCGSTYRFDLDDGRGERPLRCERPAGHAGDHRWGSAAPEGPVTW